jgi:hypothetical protein
MRQRSVYYTMKVCAVPSSGRILSGISVVCRDDQGLSVKLWNFMKYDKRELCVL